MTLLLFIVLALTEAGFTALELTKKDQKGKWTLRRIGANAVEFAAFLIMVLLPGIDFSFRFKGLIILLIIRLAISLIIWLICRKNEKIKGNPFKILSAVLSMILIFTALVPAFIFKDYKGRPLTGKYEVLQEDVILIDRARVEEFENDGSFREIPAHIYYPAGCESLEAKSLPLVIFSHGAFGYYQSNFSTYAELVSNGYVVVSLDHPYHAFFTKDSSGRTVTVDPEFISTAMEVGGKDVSESEIYPITSEWMKLRTDDMNFVVDSFIKAGETGDFDDSWFFKGNEKEKTADIISSINTKKIGLMGHSLGGATAVSVGRREDISAIIDLDGTMLGEETGVTDDGILLVNDEPYNNPILSIDNDEHHRQRIECKKSGTVYPNNVIIEKARDGYETYIAGSDHMNFTDLPLFAPSLAKMLGTGDIDPEECIDRINSLVLDFFNYSLKDEGTFSL